MFANERRIYAYIYVLIPIQEEAEDIFQETIAVMWSKFDAFEEGKDFGAWGIGIAHNIIRNYRRKKSRSHFYLMRILKTFGAGSQAIHQIPDLRIEVLRQCLNH